MRVFIGGWIVLLLSACGGSIDTQGGGSGDAGMDGGADMDASVEPDGGSAVSDPGFVQCGGQPCASATHYCCDDNAANSEKCVLMSVSACGGYRRSCDESADCEAGMQCCLIGQTSPFIEYTTFCAMDCGQSQLQVCKSDAECNGQSCLSQPCHGEIISTCAALPAAACQ